MALFGDKKPKIEIQQAPHLELHYCLTWPLGKPLPGLLEVIHTKLDLK